MKLHPSSEIRRGVIATVGGIVVSIGVGCDVQPGRPRFATSDSAGIVIMTHSRLDTTVVAKLDFPRVPAMRIGVIDGDSAYQLFRANHAYRQEDGTIIVTNSGTAEVRAFDPGGTFRWSAGRRGDGPGEYQSLAWARPYRGDSIVAFDGSTGDVSIWSPTGQYARSFRPVAPGDRPRANVVGTFADGSFLGVYGTRPVTAGDSTGAERPLRRYGIFRADGVFAREVGAFLADEQFVWADGSGASVGGLPFGRSTTVEVMANGFLVADNVAFEARILAPDGLLRRILRVAIPRSPLGAGVVDRHRADALEAVPASPFSHVRRRTIQDTPYPSYYAYYSRVVVARPGGAYWIQTAQVPNQLLDPWLVFEADGQYRGWYAIPRSLRVTDVEDGFVVGVATDDVGVQYVEVYAVRIEVSNSA